MLLLKPPPGWTVHGRYALERGLELADGKVYFPNAAGLYDFSDRPTIEESLTRQGWKPPEPPKPVYRDEHEKEAHEHPLGPGAILLLAEEEKVEIRAQDDRLWVRGASISPRLRAHLKARRDLVVHELQLRAARQWEEIV